jgi:ATP-dependent RNA helicase DDX46/PRP5
MQVKDEIASLKIPGETDFRVVAVYGQSDIRHQIDTIQRGIDIIVGTPGRLIDLL